MRPTIGTAGIRYRQTSRVWTPAAVAHLLERSLRIVWDCEAVPKQSLQLTMRSAWGRCRSAAQARYWNRVPLLNGLMVMLGALGAVTATLPADVQLDEAINPAREDHMGKPR
jgi:hypothetical protein